MFATGLVLSAMIFPTVVAITRNSLLATPQEQREASLGLGATRWETATRVVLRQARVGLLGAIVLACGRALGEAMAVIFIVGTVPQNPTVALRRRRHTFGPSAHTGVGRHSRNPEYRRPLRAGLGPACPVRCNQPGRPFADAPPIRDGGNRGRRTMSTILARRRMVERVAVGLCWLALLVAFLPLAHILYTAISIGGAKLTWTFISQPAGGLPYIGSEGGILNGLVGTMLLLFLGSVLAIPFGVAGGMYLIEFGTGQLGRGDPHHRRYSAERSLGHLGPLWLFAACQYGELVRLAVEPLRPGGRPILGLIMTPIIARVTELSLGDVPIVLREASLALGATRWHTMRRIGLRVARPGIVTGVLLALTNALGQTVALLLTNGYSLTMPHWPPSLIGQGTGLGDMGSLIYVYLEQPTPTLQAPAEAAAVVLLLLVLAISVLSRSLVALGGRGT